MQAQMTTVDTLELLEEEDVLRLRWFGKSTAREPGQPLLNMLQRSLELAASTGKTLVLDFRDIEFMNSSSITPIIRVLARAQRGTAKVRILYRKDRKWQALSFGALEVFRTHDSRIAICGE